jgi:hypothetical protein
LNISPSAVCFVFVPRSITAFLMSTDQLTMKKLNFKLVLTWKGRGPSVPGCGERFPGLTGAGAGVGAQVDAGAQADAGAKFDAKLTGAFESADEIVPAGIRPPL